MEFVVREHKQSDDLKKAENYSIRVNWFYRPKDISKKSGDSRLLYATMHSDICPLHSARGKCTVMVRDFIEDFDRYRTTPNCFWFDKLYDRYIIRFYDVIPTEKIINIPPKLQQILCEKFKYALVEVGKGKELLSTAKSCEKCSQWCSPEDSVQCAHCKHHYHMLCVDPPLFRKPTRGFGWSCAVCSGALERKLEENKGLFRDDLPVSGNDTVELGEEAGEELFNGGEETSNGVSASVTPPPPSAKTQHSSPSPTPMSRYEELEYALSRSLEAKKSISDEQRHQVGMWPFRYLGVHSKLEDILDGDDRIYPRAQSRLGSKHQAVVPEWPGRSVVYYEVDKSEKKSNKKGLKNRSSSTRLESKEGSVSAEGTDEPSPVTASETPRERPPWMQQRPPGYIERGGESTATLMWKEPEDESQVLADFLHKIGPYAEKLDIVSNTPNFVDAALKALMDANYDTAEALTVVANFTRKSLKEPTFTAEEKKRFEEGVRKFGSELHDVYKEVKTKKAADVVRYYYLWKKTPAGHKIWDNYEGRRSKKGRPELHSTTDDGLADEVANSADDSSYDLEKSEVHKRTYHCKFCSTTTSTEWRRAPGFPVAEKSNPITALCIRCARLWRKYAVIWEDPEEVLRKYNARGSVAKRRMEEELLEDSRAILAERDRERERESRKKLKPDKDLSQRASNERTTTASPPPSASSASSVKENGKKSSKKKQNSTDIVERLPSPCSVCLESYGQLLACQSCGLRVHGFCYGINEESKTWYCDTCSNDKNPVVNTLYSCAICPVRDNRELGTNGDSINSDALKRTLDNNWAHVKCAIWTPEIKFGTPSHLQPVEEISSIPTDRFREVCVICGTMKGACISCGVCGNFFHVGCAGKSNYIFGFDVQPVKSTRRDHIKIVKVGKETGFLTAVVFCPHHYKQIRTLHHMNELVAEGSQKTCLQLYCETYKQSEHTESGSMRRALLYPVTKTVENKDRKTEIREAAENLALVLSQNNTYVGYPISKSELACSTCQEKDVPFWYEEPSHESAGDHKLAEGREINHMSVRCMKCYWKAANEQDYDEAYEWEPLEIISQERVETLRSKTAEVLLAVARSESQLQFVKDARERAPLVLLETKSEPTAEVNSVGDKEEDVEKNLKSVENGDDMKDVHKTGVAVEQGPWPLPEIAARSTVNEREQSEKDMILHDILIKN
jgi:hypothetical protein